MTSILTQCDICGYVWELTTAEHRSGNVDPCPNCKRNETSPTKGGYPTDIIAYAQAAEVRAEKATPGPWEESNHTQFWEGGCIRPSRGHAICVFTNGWDQTIRDRNFISASRSDVPTLARMVVKMAKALEEIGQLPVFHDEDGLTIDIAVRANEVLAAVAGTLIGADDDDDR